MRAPRSPPLVGRSARCAVCLRRRCGVRRADLPAPRAPAAPAAPAATPAAAPAVAAPPQRYSLTVRGGVSLGAYEGGINWALLRVLEGEPGRLVDDGDRRVGRQHQRLPERRRVVPERRALGRGVAAGQPVLEGLDPGRHPRPVPARASDGGYAPGDGLFARGAFASAEVDAPAGARRRDAVPGRLPAHRRCDGDPHSAGRHRHQVGRRAIGQRRDPHPHPALRLDVRPRHRRAGVAVSPARQARPRDRRVPDVAREGRRGS